MVTQKVKKIQLSYLDIRAPDILVQKVKKFCKLVFNICFPFPLVNGAGKTHENKFSFGFKAGFFMIPVIEHDQQQVYRGAGDVNFICNLDEWRVAGKHLVVQITDHGISSLGVAVYPGYDLSFAAMDAEHIAQKQIGASVCFLPPWPVFYKKLDLCIGIDV